MAERSECDRLTCRYRYRLRVTPSQAAQLQSMFDANRYVWKMALTRWSDAWRHERLNLTAYDLTRELTDWRGRDEWLASFPFTPQVQVIRDFGKAAAAFTNKRNPAGRPHFKKKREAVSCRWQHDGFALRSDRRLHIAVAGGRIAVRVVWSRPLPSVPRTVTIRRDSAGRWWASFVVHVAPIPVGVTGSTTGLDLGLTTYATTEFADADVANPRYGRAVAKALARSHRNTSRKTPGSQNRKRARLRSAQLGAAVVQRRYDFHQKEARTLARRFDRIGVEDLRIRNMVRNRRLARSISDAAWGDFLRALEWQAKKCGHEVVRMPARNTTQNCSACGTKAKVHIGLAERTFKCSECGLVLDRDRNAARNLNPGWAVPGAPVDGSKTLIPAGIEAARGTESLAGGSTSSQSPPAGAERPTPTPGRRPV